MKRKRLLLLIVAGVAIITAACGTSGSGSADVEWSSESGSDTTTSTPAPDNGPPAIKVEGTCGSNNKTGMRLSSSGFTPNGDYQWSATYPDGKEYTYRANGGVQRADAEGRTPDWEWNCYVAEGGQDPAGTYRLKVQDLTTNEIIGTTFVVSYD